MKQTNNLPVSFKINGASDYLAPFILLPQVAPLTAVTA
jgi:hypothetical protein